MTDFNPLRPWGRRRTAPRQPTAPPCDFNPLRPWGRRPASNRDRGQADMRFQPTPPVGAETWELIDTIRHELISTHSARGGGDGNRPPGPRRLVYFNPLRPWGRRHGVPAMLYGRVQFQPTPPVGAETRSAGQRHHRGQNFNPLRPWGRRQGALGGVFDGIIISTHSARGGGDRYPHYHRDRPGKFQPTPPVGAETKRRT